MLRPTQVLASKPAARSSVSPTHPLPATRQHAELGHTIKPDTVMDSFLTFGPHIQSNSTKASERCRVLPSFNSKDGGTGTHSWWKSTKLCSSASLPTRLRSPTVLLAHLRAGHIHLLKAYANQLGTTADLICPSCGEEPQTVEHWLQRCRNAVALRQQPPTTTIPTALGSYHQPGQGACACWENPRLGRALGDMSEQQHLCMLC